MNDDLYRRFQGHYDAARAALARLMVQRFLGDLIADGEGTEAQFVAAYLLLAAREPERGMEAVAEQLRTEYLMWKQRQATLARRPTITDLGGL